MTEVRIVVRTLDIRGNPTSRGAIGCRASPRRPSVNILGINAYHGDASAALFVDGALVAAVEEERFTRVKHDTSFPHQAIRYCLDVANVSPVELDHFALSRDPKANLGKRVIHALKDRAGRQVATA